MTNEGFEQYIDYKVGLWTQKPNKDGYSYVMDEQLWTHKCNETDKKFLSKNYDYIDKEQLD